MAARFCTNCGRPLTEAEAQFGITRCAACEASASGIPSTPAEQGALLSQPVDGETSVNLRIDYPERLSRWLLFFKWLFVIPAFILVGLYGIAVFVTTFISFWAILFTGRYPSGLFDFARGYMELYARTVAYFPLLLTDQYPLGSDVGSTVHYEVEEPERLSRGLLLLKLGSFLLSVVGTLTGIVAVVLVIAAIPAWFGILFTGRYPRGMFDFMVAVVQWIARVTGWQYLMRDEWSLFATTQGVGVLVGAGAVAVAVLTIVNYATGGFSFEFETGDDQDGAGFIQDLLETPAPTTEEEEEGTTAPTFEPTPTAPTIEPTPTIPPTPSVSGPQLAVEDAPYYLDAGAVLPGFKQLDPHDEGMSNADLGLGPDFSEVVLYLSEEPFQFACMYMFVASGEIEKAALRAELRDEEGLERAALIGFYEEVGTEEVETTVQWSDPAVGDAAKLASLTADFEGVESQFEMLIFYQEEGQEAAGVFVVNLWLPGEPPTVDSVTIAQHISARIANR